MSQKYQLYKHGIAGARGLSPKPYHGRSVDNGIHWATGKIARLVCFGRARFCHYFAQEDFLYLYRYYPWNEGEMERVLHEQYGWEADPEYGPNQWRMDDFHTAFINYVYYTVWSTYSRRSTLSRNFIESST